MENNNNQHNLIEEEEEENREQQNNDNNNNNRMGENPQQDLAIVLERLGTLIDNINRNNNRSQRETKLVDIPTFRAGSQDPMT